MGGSLDGWLDTITILDVLAVLTWLVGVGGLIAALRAWSRPLVVGLRHMVEDWRGEPARPGVAARPGVMETLERQNIILDDHSRRLVEIERRADRAVYNTQANGGGSPHDATTQRLDRIEHLRNFLRTDATTKEN